MVLFRVNSRLMISLILVLFLTLPATGVHSRTSSAPSENDLTRESGDTIISGSIRKGDTASRLLRKYLPLTTIFQLEKKSRPVFSFTRFRKGQPYKIILADDRLTAFEYEIDELDRLVIRRTGDEYGVERVPIQYDIRQQALMIDIDTNLADAIRKTGENSALAWQLSDIFAWDIDFARDIRPGDRFWVLVEKRFRSDAFQGYGDILAARYKGRDLEFTAYRFKDNKGKTGYYDQTGHPLQKAFLKAPVNFSRISSGFSSKRFHPILKRYRAHPGIDYAARKNTPIKTVADGTIVKIGYNKTMGRYMTIRHINGYETSYYHMNKYARGMKRNKSVVQGDIIGYVGKTGLATGYHLCFRMKKNGRPVNPLKLQSPSAEPVYKEEMTAFSNLADRYAKRLLTAESIARSTP